MAHLKTFILLLIVVYAKAQEKCKAETDLLLIFDTSHHAKQYVENAKEFAKKVVDMFDVEHNYVRFAVQVFGNVAETVLSFSSDIDAIQKAIDELPILDGKPIVGNALKKGRTEFDNNGRTDVEQIILLFTKGDGSMYDRNEVNKQSSENHDAGIETFVALPTLTPDIEQINEAKKIATTNPAIHVIKTYKYTGQVADQRIKEFGVDACQDIKPCRCAITGERNINTCDGATIVFSGSCKYLMAGHGEEPGLPKFAIHVHNKKCETNTGSLDCASSIIFKGFDGQVFTLFNDDLKTVQHNGETLDLPFEMNFQSPNFDAVYNKEHGGNVRIYYGADGSTQLITSYNVKISFLGKNLKITVPNTLSTVLSGMCGNYDQNDQNDYVTINGTSYTGQVKSNDIALKYDAYNEIGSSYAVEGSSCGNNVKPPECDDSRQTTAYGLCSYLKDDTGPFSKCVIKFPAYATLMHEACIDAVCRCPRDDSPKEVTCDILTEFAKSCKYQFKLNQFIDTDWRSQTECPMECGPREVYSQKMSNCPATCANPWSEETCELGTSDGCKCEAGFVRQGTECVSRAFCGCRDGFGYYHKLGSSWFSHGCKGKYTCKLGEDNKPQICETEFECKAPGKCTTHYGVYGCWSFGECIVW